ncbi:hypothetical protein [Brucella anthropi]|uniref:hypothetical protein n=1 Tax=Brucella anthropi TaxID=529 RepID=UPI00068F6190|nr:hypothetical protein [Brucella anthropi]
MGAPLFYDIFRILVGSHTMTIMPDIRELRSTCEQMEERYLINPTIDASYRRLADRFAADLTVERDILLSRCAALMAIKFLSEDAAL